MQLLLRGRMLIHPEVLAVLGQTFLGPPVDQVVRFGGQRLGRPACSLGRHACQGALASAEASKKEVSLRLGDARKRRGPLSLQSAVQKVVF